MASFLGFVFRGVFGRVGKVPAWRRVGSVPDMSTPFGLARDRTSNDDAGSPSRRGLAVVCCFCRHAIGWGHLLFSYLEDRTFREHATELMAESMDEVERRPFWRNANHDCIFHLPVDAVLTRDDNIPSPVLSTQDLQSMRIVRVPSGGLAGVDGVKPSRS